MELMQLFGILAVLYQTLKLLASRLLELRVLIALSLHPAIDAFKLVQIEQFHVVELQSSAENEFSRLRVLVETADGLDADCTSKVLDVLEGKHEQCNLLFTIEMTGFVLADQNADLEEDVKDSVTVHRLRLIFLLLCSNIFHVVGCKLLLGLAFRSLLERSE